MKIFYEAMTRFISLLARATGAMKSSLPVFEHLWSHSHTLKNSLWNGNRAAQLDNSCKIALSKGELTETCPPDVSKGGFICIIFY